MTLQSTAYQKDANSGPKLSLKAHAVHQKVQRRHAVLAGLSPASCECVRTWDVFCLALAETLVIVMTEQNMIRIPQLGPCHGRHSFHTYIGIKQEPNKKLDAAALMHTDLRREAVHLLGD